MIKVRVCFLDMFSAMFKDVYNRDSDNFSSSGRHRQPSQQAPRSGLCAAAMRIIPFD
jgi:hypothetical protein